MSDATLARPSTTEIPSLRTSTIAGVALSAVMAVVLLIRDTNDGPAWRVGSVLGAAIAVATAIVFGVVVRRTRAKGLARSSARAALALAVVAALSIVAFWMALTPVFAVGALVLAHDADRRPFAGERLAAAAGGLAAVALLAGLVLSVVG